MIVNYRYWNKIRNCGDAITAYILSARMGLTPRTVAADQPHLLATGSIFFWANAQSQIWGSGLIRGDARIKLPSEQIHAVRGKRTLAALRAAGLPIGDLPLGDPGILVDYLLDDPEFAGLPTDYAAAIVPHHRSLSRGKTRAGGGEICVVDMRDNSLLPLRQIQQSRVVISQSLHGLVFAAALGKPYIWISETDDETWRFKFDDWFSTTGNPQAQPLPIDTSLDRLIAAAELRPCVADRDALLAAFPRDLVCAPLDRPLIDFTACRAMPVAITRSDTVAAFGRLGPEADPRKVERAAHQVRLAVRRAFARWSEMPYVMLLPSGTEMPPVALEALAAFMDRNPGVEALSVLPRSAPPRAEDVVPVKRLSTDRAEITEGACFAGAGLVLRPSLAFSPELAFFTYRAV